MMAIKLSARLTLEIIMPSALAANERVLVVQNIFLGIYCNQAAASKSEIAGASRRAKLAVDIMLRVIILDWPEKSEQLDVTKCIS